eukprot:7931170-Ditylum_brightwellii.AAC.1
MQFNWRKGSKKGKLTNRFGNHNSTKAIKQFNNLCADGGKDCKEVRAYKAESDVKKKRKIEEVSVKLERYHAEQGATETKGKNSEGTKKWKTQQNIRHMMNPQSYCE